MWLFIQQCHKLSDIADKNILGIPNLFEGVEKKHDGEGDYDKQW